MARARSPDRLKAEEMYLEHKGKIDLVDIASELDRPPGTIRGWKNKDEWDNKLNGTFQKKSDKNTERSNKKKATKTIREVVRDIDKEIVEEVLENNELTDKQQLFCIHYIKYFNATKSYQKAYECSYTTALVNGPRLLGNARVDKQIQELKASRFQGAYLEAPDILQQHIDIARADITDFAEFGSREFPEKDIDGTIRTDKEGKPIMDSRSYISFKDSSEVDGTLISEIKMSKDGPVLKLHDKRNSLNFLTTHKGLLSALDEAKLKIAQDKLELEKAKVNGDDGETEDDGFIDALSGKLEQVWDDIDEEN